MVTKSESASKSTETFANKSNINKTAKSANFSVTQISMDNIIEHIKKADRNLDSKLSKQPFALKLERQSGIKKTHMVYTLVAAIVFLTLYRFATNFVISMVLLAYPLILSLEAVESHNKAKDAHILSYWSVIALVQLIESIIPFVRRYIPLYNILKMTFAVYLYLPQTKVITIY